MVVEPWLQVGAVQAKLTAGLLQQRQGVAAALLRSAEGLQFGVLTEGKAAAWISLGGLFCGAGLWMAKRPGDSNSMAGSSWAAGSSVLRGGASWLFMRSSVAVAHHVDMGDASVEKFAADNSKAKAFIERAGMHLGAEHLLLQAAFLGLADGGS